MACKWRKAQLRSLLQNCLRFLLPFPSLDLSKFVPDPARALQIQAVIIRISYIDPIDGKLWSWVNQSLGAMIVYWYSENLLNPWSKWKRAIPKSLASFNMAEMAEQDRTEPILKRTDSENRNQSLSVTAKDGLPFVGLWCCTLVIKLVSVCSRWFPRLLLILPLCSQINCCVLVLTSSGISCHKCVDSITKRFPWTYKSCNDCLHVFSVNSNASNCKEASWTTCLLYN